MQDVHLSNSTPRPPDGEFVLRKRRACNTDIRRIRSRCRAIFRPCIFIIPLYSYDLSRHGASCLRIRLQMQLGRTLSTANGGGSLLLIELHAVQDVLPRYYRFCCNLRFLCPFGRSMNSLQTPLTLPARHQRRHSSSSCFSSYRHAASGLISP